MSQMYPHFKVFVVLPAYNAESTLRQTYDDIPKKWIDEVLLVDDASTDNTLKHAKSLGITTVEHIVNSGYGSNQKTCYQEAVRRGADIIIMVHPDHQYDPRLVPDMLLPILRGDADAVFGSRMMEPGGALQGGMPYWKYIANKILTLVGNIVLRLRLTEYHSGFRAYTKEVIERLPIDMNSDGFVFDTEIIIQLKLANLRIKEVPISTRYFKGASMIGLFPSVKYGLGILYNLTLYCMHVWGVKKIAKFDIVRNSKL